jgi:hypothetical protein
MADDRFVYARVGGLWNHPLLDPSAIDKFGSLRGLLIWDTLKRERHVEHPSATQQWTSPLLDVRDASRRIYASGEALRHNRPDRVLPIVSA